MARNEAWRGLKVGDRVTIFKMPPPGVYLHAETRRLYHKLIARGRSLRVARVDGDGIPWVECRFYAGGKWEYHSLAVNDNIFRKVKSRVRVRGAGVRG